MPRRADRSRAPRIPSPPRDGFTLLEVLVALVILSGTLLLCYRVTTSSLGALEDGENQYRATLLGEATVIQFLSPFPAAGRTEGAYSSPDEAFRYELEVREAAHQDARELHATVIWEGPAGSRRVDVPGVSVR